MLVFKIKFNNSIPNNWKSEFINHSIRNNIEIDLSKYKFISNNIVQCPIITSNAKTN